MRTSARLLAALLSLIAGPALAQNVPANTVQGRLGIPAGGGKVESIPFATLAPQLGIPPITNSMHGGVRVWPVPSSVPNVVGNLIGFNANGGSLGCNVLTPRACVQAAIAAALPSTGNIFTQDFQRDIDIKLGYAGFLSTITWPGYQNVAARVTGTGFMDAVQDSCEMCDFQYLATQLDTWTFNPISAGAPGGDSLFQIVDSRFFATTTFHVSFTTPNFTNSSLEIVELNGDPVPSATLFNVPSVAGGQNWGSSHFTIHHAHANAGHIATYFAIGNGTPSPTQRFGFNFWNLHIDNSGSDGSQDGFVTWASKDIAIIRSDGFTTGRNIWFRSGSQANILVLQADAAASTPVNDDNGATSTNMYLLGGQGIWFGQLRYAPLNSSTSTGMAYLGTHPNGKGFVINSTAAPTNGQVLAGNTGSDPTLKSPSQLLDFLGSTEGQWLSRSASAWIATQSPILGGSGVSANIGLRGLTSGTVTLKVGAIAGTYNLILPSTVGAAGSVLTSQAGGSNAMTWTPLAVPILAFDGDSLTAGGGTTNTPLPPYLTTNTATYDAFFAAANAVANYATGGVTAQTIAANYTTRGHLSAKTAATQDVYFFYNAGTNDIFGARTAAQIYADLKTVWAAARADGMKVVASTVKQSTSFTGPNLTTLATLNASILSDTTLYDYVVRMDLLFPDATYFDADGIHINAAGYARWVAEIKRVMRNSFGQNAVIPAGYVLGNNDATPRQANGVSLTGMLDTIAATDGFMLYRTGGVWTAAGTPFLGGSGGVSGSLGLRGQTSGSVNIQVKDAAGSYNFILPTTVGGAGAVLASQGGGSTAMTWTTLASVASSGSASDLGSGTLAAARGGAGTVNGILKADGSGNVSAATAGTDYVTSSSTNTFTNKTYDTAGTGNSFSVSGVAVSRGQYPGVNTNTNATAGNIGEYTSTSVASTGVSLSTGTNADLNAGGTSFTAGDWDIGCTAHFLAGAGTTIAYAQASLSTTSVTQVSTPGFYTTLVPGGIAPSSFIQSGFDLTAVVSPIRVSIASTTSYFCVVRASFATSTLSAYGLVHGRRAH